MKHRGEAPEEEEGGDEAERVDDLPPGPLSEIRRLHLGHLGFQVMSSCLS